MARALQRTVHAQQAVEFGEMFRLLFQSVQVAGNPPLRAELAVPAGQSTEGGKMARQNINLVAADPSYPVITVGWVHLAQRSACLRSYGYVATVFAQRFKGRPLGFDEAAYQKFFDAAYSVLHVQALQVQIEQQLVGALSARPMDAPGGRWTAGKIALLMLGLAVFFAGAAGLVYMLVLRS